MTDFFLCEMALPSVGIKPYPCIFPKGHNDFILAPNKEIRPVNALATDEEALALFRALTIFYGHEPAQEPTHVPKCCHSHTGLLAGIAMIHETYLTIRTFHTDAFGHVNNSRHFELLEEARWRYAEDIGLVDLLAQDNLGFIIIDARLRFRLPILEGETIRIDTCLTSLGSASGEVRQLVYKPDNPKIALKSLFHFILIDRTTGSPVPIESEIRKLLLSVIENQETPTP